MAFLLSNLLQNFYSDTGQTDPQFGVFNATGGGTTSFVNDNWQYLESAPEQDSFINDLAIVVRDAAGAGAAPENEYQRISAYADATRTGTTGTFTAGIASGDTIMIAKQAAFPVQQVIFCVNRALSNLGDIVLRYTSLTTGSSQTEYSLPVALKRREPLKVFYQGITGDSDNNQWIPVTDYRMGPDLPGTAGILYLPQEVSGRSILLWYEGVHPVVAAYNDPISETIHPSLITAATIVEALSWFNRLDGNQGSNEYYLRLENQYRNEILPVLEVKYRPQKPNPQTKWFDAGDNYPYPKTGDYPRH